MDQNQPSTSTNQSSVIFGEIVEKLKAMGHVVILPSSRDSGSGPEQPIRILQEFGLEDDKIVDLFVTKPRLFKVSTNQWREKLTLFEETGFSLFQAIFLLSRNPDLFKMDNLVLLNRFETIRQVGVKGEHLPNMVYASPEVLTEATNEQIRRSANNLKSFFTTEQVSHERGGGGGGGKGKPTRQSRLVLQVLKKKPQKKV